MNNCLTCKSCPATLLRTGIKLSESNNDFCNSGVYMRYKRSKNENDQVFGFWSDCKKYKGNG